MLLFSIQLMMVAVVVVLSLQMLSSLSRAFLVVIPRKFYICRQRINILNGGSKGLKLFLYCVYKCVVCERSCTLEKCVRALERDKRANAKKFIRINWNDELWVVYACCVCVWVYALKWSLEIFSVSTHDTGTVYVMCIHSIHVLNDNFFSFLFRLADVCVLL